MMEDRLPLVVVVPTSPSGRDSSAKTYCEEFVSPLHKPHSKPFASPEPQHDNPTDPTGSECSTGSASVASDIDSSCEGSIASAADSIELEDLSTSMEFELEVKKLKELKSQKEQNHLKNMQAYHPAVHPMAQQQAMHNLPQRHSQLHPQQEKKLKHEAMQEQTRMVHEIHNMLSLIIDDDRDSSPTSGSKYHNSRHNGSDNSSKQKSRSRNNIKSLHSQRHDEMRDIAVRAKERMGQLENNIDELHGSFRSIGTSRRSAMPSKFHNSHRGAHQMEGFVELDCDPCRPVEDSLHRSFKSIPAPPFSLDETTVQSKRFVALDMISERLLSERHTSHPRSVAKPQPRRGKPVTSSLHDQLNKSFNLHDQLNKSFNNKSVNLHHQFSESFDLTKSPKVQKAMRYSSHRRVTPITPSMHERFNTSFSPHDQFSNSFDFSKSPKVQKALRLSSHRRASTSRHSRTMPAAPSLQDSFNLTRSPSVRQSSQISVAHSVSSTDSQTTDQFSASFSTELRSPSTRQSSRKLHDSFSRSFNFEKSPVVQKALRMSTHRRSKQRMAMVSPEPVQRKPIVSPEGTRRSHRVTTASPANSKSLLGEKLHKQITKTQRDLAGRITSVLTEYENAEQLSNLLQGPEDCMAERIVEVLEVLKGRGAKPRTAVN